MTFALCDGLRQVIFFFVKNETGLNFGWERVSIGGDVMALCNSYRV
jgi:hypothetical protein